MRETFFTDPVLARTSATITRCRGTKEALGKAQRAYGIGRRREDSSAHGGRTKDKDWRWLANET